ncbi:hypothetical protein SS05631_c06670 [Sinorhizobium sp. CCBAU 05631]|nr:hypothetical protein SS05631_c06670 [Sinorhizobium sp. CCBAU 05631]
MGMSPPGIFWMSPPSFLSLALVKTKMLFYRGAAGHGV